MSKKPTGFAAPKLNNEVAKSFVAGSKTRAKPAAKEEAKPVRITVDMPPALHRSLKIAALDRKQSMRELILDLLEQELGT